MGCRTLRFPKWSKSVIHSSKVPKVVKFRDTFAFFATGRDGTRGTQPEDPQKRKHKILYRKRENKKLYRERENNNFILQKRKQKQIYRERENKSGQIPWYIRHFLRFAKLSNSVIHSSLLAQMVKFRDTFFLLALCKTIGKMVQKCDTFVTSGTHGPIPWYIRFSER